MSKIIKDRKGEGPVPGKSSTLSDQFLPLAELWPDSGPDAWKSPSGKALEVKSKQEEILAQAHQDAERIRKQAYEEGYARGEGEGQAKYKEAVSKLEAVITALDRKIGARNERHEEELLLLLKTMVDRLVHHEISVSQEVIRSCLREALQYVAENSRIKVHLHADDFERLREASLEDPSLLEGKNRLQLVEDPAVEAGGCLLETDFGEVDATLDTRRQKLYDAVDAIFRNLIDHDGLDQESGR